MRILVNVLRFHEYGPSTTLACLFGLLTASNLDLSWILVLIFPSLSSAFGFVLNDISDVELDSLQPKTRNPIARQQIRKKQAAIIALIFLAVSVMVLSALPPTTAIIGVVTLFLYFAYSQGFRAKARPIWDVVFHGLWYSLFIAMGYTFAKPFDAVALMLSITAFFPAATMELLNEIRDHETDQKMIRTSATLLGKRNSLVLCLIFILCTYAAGTLLTLTGVFPVQLLAAAPSAILFILPLHGSIRLEERAVNTGRDHYRQLLRKLTIAGAISASLSLALLLIYR